MTKVLIFEDDSYIIEILTHFLRVLGCECDFYKPKDVYDAIERINDSYDAIISDYNMPNLTGWDIYNSLSDKDKKKIIIITGGIIDHEEEKVLKQNNIKIVSKPFNLDDLYNALKNN